MGRVSRRMFIYGGALLFGGCAARKIVPEIPIDLEAQKAMEMAERSSANSMFWRNGLTGGGNALDGVTGMLNGDGAIVLATDGTDPNLYFYVYNSSDTTSESSPGVIEPDTGSGAWNLTDLYTKSVITTASDGHHFLNVSNSASFQGSPSDGDCTYNKTDDTWCCYDGSAWGCATL